MKPKQGRDKPGRDMANPAALTGLVFLLLAGCLLGWLVKTAWTAELQGSGWTVQDQGGAKAAQPASQEQPATAGQAQGLPEQLGDVQEEQPTFLNPDSIPDSVAVPMADWVFEVPVDVKNLPDAVQELMVVCRVHGFYHGKWHEIGENGKIVPIVDGSCQRDVLIGVKYLRKDGMPTNHPKRVEYRCRMYLRGPGPDHTWALPEDAKVSPSWRWADPDQPFENTVSGAVPSHLE